MSKGTRRWSAVAAALAVAACSGGSDSSGPAPSIQVTASPTALTVQQGQSGTVAVSLTRGGGFSAAVNVSVDGLPAGVTVGVTPTQLTGAVTTATVTVTVAASVAPGTYTATIHASAAGVGEATATYTLTVTGIPNYALSATPAALSIGQGVSAVTAIGIARTNFPGAVTLSLVSPPDGITGTFSQNPANGDNSQLTVNVAATVPTGTYTLTVKGSATGLSDKTTTVQVTVTEKPDYQLSLTPNTVSITAGSSGQATVNISRSNYTGAVTLALSSPPAGITATFNPAAPTTNSSVMTIAVANTVAAGDYVVTVAGTAAGVPTRIDPHTGFATEMFAPGDRSTSITVTVTAAPDFSLAASPSTVNASQGGTANTTVTITRTNLTANVDLSLDSPPAGITGVFTPASATGATSALVISVAGNVAVGSYTVTIKGTATGAGSRTTTLTVNVVAGPTVSLSVNPTSLNIEQGSSSSTTLTLSRVNFVDPVTPSASGQPGGMNISFNPTPITGNTSTVNVQVGGGVGVGTYQVTITGAAGAAGNPTTQLTVNVTAPAGGSSSVEFCSADAPQMFWRKSGGSWAQVTGTVVGNVTKFSFSISGATGAIAYLDAFGTSVRAAPRGATRAQTRVMRDAKAARDRAMKRLGAPWTRMAAVQAADLSDYETTVFYGTAAELNQTGVDCSQPPVTMPRQVTAQNLSLTELGLLGYGGANATLFAGMSSYSVSLPAGPADFLAVFAPIATPFDWQTYRIGRGQTGDITFDRTGAPALTPFTVTAVGGMGGISGYTFGESIEGANGSIGDFFITDPSNTMPTANGFFIPAASALPTDLHSFSVLNTLLGTNSSDFILSLQYFGSTPPGSGNLDLLPAVPAFTVAPTSGTTNPGFSVSGTTPTQSQAGPISAIFSTTTASSTDNTWFIMATRSFLNAAGMVGNYQLQVEDLPGFPAGAVLATLGSTDVTMTSTNVTGGLGNGSYLRTATRSQTQ